MNINKEEKKAKEEKLEKIKKSKALFVGTPVHSEVSLHFMKSCLDLQKECLLNNIQPMFELVGERSLVKYKEPNLILTKLRCNKTGKYLDIKNHNTYDVSVVKEYKNYNLDDLLDLKKNKKYIEGWIVHFEDDTILKVKTDWWINKKNKKK